MNSHKFTRRAVVRGGVASAVAAGVALDAATRAGAKTPDGELVVGRFVSADGPRSATVSLQGERSISVLLDSAAFVVHGADGVVESLAAFVPGETVAVRGARTRQGIAAIEFQSVYTSVAGTAETDASGDVLATPSGRVRVPRAVARRDLPSGVRNGEAYFATIWTHPATGEATAVDVTAAS